MKFPPIHQRTVFYIALISFLLLVGAQVVWLNNTFRLNERDFEEKVKNTLRVFNNDFQANPILTRNMQQVWENPMAIHTLAPAIKYAIDTCFQRNNLPTDYVFGIGATKEKKLFWASDTAFTRELQASRSAIIALCMDKAGALEMKFHFPYKQKHIVTALMPMLLLSGSSILILLLCLVTLMHMLKKMARLSTIKDDFINNMTHELKTPLFTVSIASKMLAEQDTRQEANRTKYILSIQQEVKRLNNLVEKILQTSLMQQKKLTLEKRSVDLHQAVHRSIAGFSLIQAQKNGTIALALDAQSHLIEGDETHIENSIFNLLDNAFKYATTRPQVVISTKNAENSILLSIKDNGIGLDSETKNLVFERFFRAHTGNLHDIKGYGIGLSYVKSVAEAHHGKISVNSTINQGTEFTLQFPLQRL